MADTTEPQTDLTFPYLLELDLTQQQQDVIDQLVYDSFDMYWKLPIDRDRCNDLIRHETTTEGTECYNPLLALKGDKIVGLICSYPTEELDLRQRASLLSIMRVLRGAERGEFKKTLEDDSYTVEELPFTDGQYISRVAVAQSARGMGIGARLLEKFLALHHGKRISLHVDKTNEPAIGYYLNSDFIFCRGTGFTKLVMTLPKQ